MSKRQTEVDGDEIDAKGGDVATETADDRTDDLFGDMTPETRLDVPVDRRIAPSDRLDAGTAVGRYLVLGCIGVGGMGMVYSAYDPKLDRKVALKLLRPKADPDDQERATARLVREAQVMAKINHSNVVTIYDVGTHQGRVFMAMEYISGRALRKWLKQETEAGWRRIVDVFVQAGRGLTALHEAGLVHRDFKPLNVMMGDDGRICVVDFGLAKRSESLGGEDSQDSAQSELTPAEEELVSAERGPGTEESDQPLTHAGSVVGTPRYMSPEQFAGRPTDNRTDQFSFAMAMYEALYDSHPFHEGRSKDYSAAVLRGELRPVPKDTKVPARIHKVLSRSLSANMDERYPSMELMLTDLTHARRKGRFDLLAGGAIIAALALTGLIAGQSRASSAPVCRDAASRWAKVWDSDRKATIRAGFSAAKVPFADVAWRNASSQLDRYVASWSSTYQDACEATHLRGEQSRDLLDRRMLCLGTRREEARALVEAFEDADVELVQNAVAAVYSLSSVAPCSDLSLRSSRLTPPAVDATREIVKDLSMQTARARGKLHAGRFGEALEIATKANAIAEGIDYPQAQAEVLFLLGDLQENAPQAEASLVQAYRAAEMAGDDKLRAYIASNLVYVVGHKQTRFPEAILWGQLAEAALKRAGGDKDVEASLHLHSAAMLTTKDENQAALAHIRSGLEILRSMHEEEHADVVGALNNEALVLGRLERWDESLAGHQRALALSTKLHGPSHPDVAISHNNIAVVYDATERPQESREHLEIAQRIWQEALGPEHPDVACALVNLGEWHESRELPAQALEYYQQASSILEKALGPNDQEVAFALTGVGRVHLTQEQPRDAVPFLERALEIRAAPGADQHERAHTAYLLAVALWDSGQDKVRAKKLVDMAIPIFEKVGAEADEELAEARRWLAKR